MPKTMKHRRKWSMKYKKSINCKKPRGFSQKQHCKYGRTKKRVKKTLKGGVGERQFGTVLAKGAMQVASGFGRGAVNVATGVVDDSIRRELLKQQYSKQMDATKYNPPNYNNENQENNRNNGNIYTGVDNSKFPTLSPKNSSPQISAPSKNLFDDF
jgi:hypothetical protein